MKVLFVCTANVCRSVLAEGYLRHLAAGKNVSGIESFSAGVNAMKGQPPFDCALEVARQFGFDVSGKRGQQLTAEIVQQADLVLCMETWQASVVMQLGGGGPADKVALLGSYHPQGKPLFQIRDPAAFRVPETLKTFELIRLSCDRLLASLAGQSS